MSEDGLRYDDDKNQLELIPPEWIWVLGEILTAGARKYAERNWERGMKHSKLIGCAMRHLLAYLRGERYDTKPDKRGRPGTGCHHLGLVAWNVLALMTYDIWGKGTFDLPYAPKKGDEFPLPTAVEVERGKEEAS